MKLKSDKVLSKIGRNKNGLARIWLEGAKLTKHGLKWNTKITIVFNSNSIIVQADPAGDKKISGRIRDEKEIPILDLRSNKITEFTEGFERVQAVISNQKIVITLYNEDQ